MEREIERQWWAWQTADMGISPFLARELFMVIVTVKPKAQIKTRQLSICF